MLIDKLKAAYVRHGYRLYDKGEYNVNLFGIRNMGDLHSNGFNDLIGVLYIYQGSFNLFSCAGTTDPGTVSRTNPVNSQGCAILPCGQYPKLFRLGKHKGQYDALVQNVPVSLYRDNNKDTRLDMDRLMPPAMCGINLHRANAKHKSVQVDNWSAGCQVIADPNDFAAFMGIVNSSAKRYGNVFTYTLFESTDL